MSYRSCSHERSGSVTCGTAHPSALKLIQRAQGCVRTTKNWSMYFFAVLASVSLDTT